MTPPTKLILKHLDTYGPSTYDELRQPVGLCIDQVCILVRRAKQQGLVHRCGWRRTPGKNYQMLFDTGPGVDVPRPPRRDGKERHRAYYAKNRLVLREKQHQWYLKNRDSKLKAVRAWEAKNKAKVKKTHRAAARRYAAKKRLAATSKYRVFPWNPACST